MPGASRPTTCTQTESPAATRSRYRGVRHDRSGDTARAASRSYRLLFPLPWKIQSVMAGNATGPGPAAGGRGTRMVVAAQRTETSVRVQLAYGTTGLEIDVDPDVTTVVEPVHQRAAADPGAVLRAALRQPVTGPP